VRIAEELVLRVEADIGKRIGSGLLQPHRKDLEARPNVPISKEWLPMFFSAAIRQ
jgi:hypothetical protein